MALAERRDGIVIRVRVGRQEPKRHVFVRGPLHLPAAHHAQTVAVQQQAHHHHRLVSRQAPSIACIRLADAYWDTYQKDYMQKGDRWVWRSIGLAGVLLAVVALIVNRPPDFLNATAVGLPTEKGSLLLAVAVSTLMYLIHTCVRLALSSHHLAGDAKERYQLTHVFLSLIQKQAIQPDDRNIVPAALFSRADTGLLRHDGSPTMPNSNGQLIETLRRS
jgi:hypothetical protein